ncbi:LOW QUALITY PROTEIN: coiled-coil domain-containing protein 15 isoform X2 [Cricetulus griseus]|uniref:LOW QUALITY PROTEIN: coiled-coil domain-containing protein 15 isoform X2 n=1 Tax=Cricetulus griseus TaxID=10029 RepID=A0A9J7FSH4_CRIGR|nr:LOW QUALITY PROTEIN: coiled-coil domain-containing protein 15 isoform X2 [Cricetulus griseus]
MPGGMAPLKKPRNPTKLPLALDPTKSKDVLAVLAERNLPIVPVGAWVEPASPSCSEIPAQTSAYMIEEEIKEQQRRKQESLKHFQRQVRHRVNQQVKLRKKQQLQKSCKAAEKEGSVAMQCSDSAHLTPKRTSVFPSNLNAAMGSYMLSSSQVLGDATEVGENQNHLFEQQAQALSQTMKQARHQLASFKTVSKKKTSVFLNGRRKSSPTQEKALLRKPACIKINKETREEPPCKIHEGPLTTVHYQNFMENQDLGCGEIVTGEKERDLLLGHQQVLLSEDKEKALSKVQKVKFKNPLVVVIKEDEQKQLNLHSLQAVLPESQDYFVEVQGNRPESQSDVIDVLNVEPKASSIEPKAPGVEPITQATGTEFKTTEPEGQALRTEIKGIFKTQTVELDGNIELEAQDHLPPNQAFLSRYKDFLPKCQEQDSLPKDHRGLSKYWNVLPKCQDQNFLPADQVPRNQLALPEEQSHLLKCQNEDLSPEEQSFLPRHQYILPIYQDQRGLHVLPKCQHHDVLSKDQNNLHKYQEQDFPLQNQEVNFKDPFSDKTNGKGREIFFQATYQCLPSKSQVQDFIRDQDMFLKQLSTFVEGEREDEELPLECHQYAPPQVQDQIFHREQYRSCEQTSCDMIDERWRKELYPESYRCGLHEIQDSGSAINQSLHFRQEPSVNTAERCQEDLHLGGCERLPPRHQRGTCNRRQQVSEEYRSGLSTEYQTLLAFQSGVDQEEEKKERQKQYLRHRRLFMDIEREQVKEQNRQREQKKRIERIKKKKEQQRYAEEQRLLRMRCHEEPYSEEKINDALAQLQLEEIKGAREKQHQREKEYIRYVEALRAQVQEKMKLYNITLPPLCCCGPDFWDAHPDTCANNCIFYKNYKAYNRALHSVINSSDISEGIATLRNAIRNFASVHRGTSKKGSVASSCCSPSSFMPVITCPESLSALLRAACTRTAQSWSDPIMIPTISMTPHGAAGVHLTKMTTKSYWELWTTPS